MAFFSMHQDYDVEMWRYTRDLKANTQDLRSHAHIPEKKSKLMGVEIATDLHGLRIGLPNGSEHPPILALGDSFTLGWGVAAAETYLAQLQKICAKMKVPVLNAGVGNYNLGQVVAQAKLMVPIHRPSALLYGFYWNDAEPTQREPDSWIARHSYLFLFWRKVQVRLLHFGGSKNSYLGYYESTFEGDSWKIFEANARALSALARKEEIPLYVALLPELREAGDPQVKKIYQKVELLFESLGVPSVNLVDALPPRPAKEYWVAADDPHPNGLAQREIGLGLAKKFWPICLQP